MPDFMSSDFYTFTKASSAKVKVFADMNPAQLETAFMRKRVRGKFVG